ncbi:MAG: glutamine synthetase family protein [Clostridia bacterium]|nr:glutamine synthetase family protein [Clostridia bacterium]
MGFTADEVLQYVAEEDVKFIRLAFCDVFGKQKNISIMPDELNRAFSSGIAIDGSAIRGFSDAVHSDLLLKPDPATLSVLPWRPDHGRVVRLFCNIAKPDGGVFLPDTRALLMNAVREAAEMGVSFAFGSEMEFYLFNRDENGEPTSVPYDRAGYMDIAPDDKGENVRREVCLTLEQMGIHPESSHHEEGPGQNEIDFRFSEPLRAADDAVTFKTVVNTVAARCGLNADFSPKPLPDCAGNGMHINFSVKTADGSDAMPYVIAGVLDHIREMTLFLNVSDRSYQRLGQRKAPKYISWSRENRSQLIRIPAAEGEYKRAELRSPDPLCNPYLAYALMIYAGLDGIRKKTPLPDAVNENLFDPSSPAVSGLKTLPLSLGKAKTEANCDFIRQHIPAELLNAYLTI